MKKVTHPAIHSQKGTSFMTKVTHPINRLPFFLPRSYLIHLTRQEIWKIIHIDETMYTRKSYMGYDCKKDKQ